MGNHFAILSLILLGLPSLDAQEAPPQSHLEITGSHRLRITYDSSFVWPRSGGGTAVFYLPVPPNTGAQQIEHFTSNLKGEITTDDAIPPHHLLTATLHHASGDERSVHWHVEIIGQFQTPPVVDAPPSPYELQEIVRRRPGMDIPRLDRIDQLEQRCFSRLARFLRPAPQDRSRVTGDLWLPRGSSAYLKANGRYSYPPVVCMELAATPPPASDFAVIAAAFPWFSPPPAVPIKFRPGCLSASGSTGAPA